MENGSGVRNNGGEVFPNRGAKNGKSVQALQRILNEVKGILECNRMLIQEMEQKHEASEADNFSHNIALTFELHNNMTRVMELYSDLSSSLSLAKGSPTNAEATKEG